MKKIKLSIAFVFSLLACGQPSHEITSAAVASEAAAPAVLHVEGMVCKGCENAIKATLKKLPGISEVSASHVDKTVTVNFDKQKISLNDIIDAIKALGYTVAIPD